MNRRAGLGLAQGFMQGYDFMDRVDKRERRMGLMEASNSRAEDSHRWRGEQMEHQREEWQRADDARLVQAMNEGVQSGRIDPRVAGEFGRRFDVDWSNYVNPEFGQSLQVLEGTVKGEHSMRSPEFRNAFENVFRTEINKGTGEEYEGADGAHRIEQKRLAGVYPGPDGKTLMVDLDVLDRGPNGELWRRAPVTTNRSANDDEVRAIPLEAALRKLKGHQMMYEAVQASPELQSVIRQYAARTGAALPEPRETYGQPMRHPELGWVQPGPNGQLHQLSSQENERYGEAFQHPQLGWVQPGPDGKLHQMDDPKNGGDPEWGRLSDGALYNKRTGETRGLSGTGGQQLNSSQLSQIQQTSRNFHGKFNPDGSFLGIPDGAREKYALAMQRAQELAQRNVPLFEAINIANLSVLDSMSEADALAIAENEANEQHGGVFAGGERDRYIEERVPQLLQESRQALGHYQQLTGGRGGLQNVPDPAETGEGSGPQRQPDGSYSGRVEREASSQKTPEQIRSEFRQGLISEAEAIAALQQRGYE